MAAANDGPLLGSAGSDAYPRKRALPYSRITTSVVSLFLLAVILLSVGSRPQLRLDSFPAPSLPQTATTGNRPPSLPVDVQNNLHLSFDQCQHEFPLLFQQLQDNAAIWRQKGGIRKVHVDEAMDKCRLGCVRMIIKDGIVYIKKFAHPMQTRVQEVVSLFKTAVEGADWADAQAFDDTELVLNVFDFEDDIVQSHAAWVLTKKVNQTVESGQYLMPDFGFGAWPEAGIATYAHFRREAQHVNDEYDWAAKGHRAFFRGDPYVGEHGNAARKDLLAQIHKPGADIWADVARTSFGGTQEGGEPITKFIRIEDHCKHRYLLHSEGVSYSGRSKYIMGCQSAVITHDLEWTQHFHPALNADPNSPNQNIFISPGNNFERLPELMLGLQKEDQAMLSIGSRSPSRGYTVAQNAKRTLVDRYLTPASLACYVRGALRSYSSVLDRSTFNDGKGPTVGWGGGVAQHVGARPLHELKDALHGAMDATTWAAIGFPEYPPP